MRISAKLIDQLRREEIRQFGYLGTDDPAHLIVWVGPAGPYQVKEVPTWASVQPVGCINKGQPAGQLYYSGVIEVRVNANDSADMRTGKIVLEQIGTTAGCKDPCRHEVELRQAANPAKVQDKPRPLTDAEKLEVCRQENEVLHLMAGLEPPPEQPTEEPARPATPMG